MTTSRQTILDAIRAGIGPRDVAAARDAASRRLAGRAPNLVPARAQGSRRDLVKRFAAMAEEVSATVARVTHPGAVAGATIDYLRRNNLPMRALIAPHPDLAAMGWEARPLLELRRGERAEPFDETAITLAFRGVAETGTLMLHSGPDTPTTMNFLPENCIVVLRARDLVGSYEEAFAALRAARAGEDGRTLMPRAVNFVTGPSRSADIEQTLQLGAHGPRRLHIVLIDDEAAAAA
jgi:L-lactate dehydrogenase complex protein LldG